MAEIITGPDLADLPGVQGYTADQLARTATRLNGLIDDAWKSPEAPAPPWVVEIALDAAVRYLSNPKGLESWTRSVDDASRTERVRTGDRTGLYLTKSQLRRLRGSSAGRARSTRLRVPGYQP